jgi:hypothetical protein
MISEKRFGLYSFYEYTKTPMFRWINPLVLTILSVSLMVYIFINNMNVPLWICFMPFTVYMVTMVISYYFYSETRSIKRTNNEQQ